MSNNRVREWFFWREAPKKSRNPFKPAISSFASRLEQALREKTVLWDTGSNQSCGQRGKTHATVAALGQDGLFSTKLPFLSGWCWASFSVYVLDFATDLGVTSGMCLLPAFFVHVERSGIEMFVWVGNCLSLVFVQELRSLPLFILLFAGIKDLKPL